MDITNTTQLVFTLEITAVWHARGTVTGSHAWNYKRWHVWETCFINEKSWANVWKVEQLSTDGAAATFGLHKGLTAFVKKEQNRLSHDPGDLICALHHAPRSLCSTLMPTIVSCVNVVESRGFNSHRCMELLHDLDSKYRDCVDYRSGVAELWEHAHEFLKTVGWSQAVHGDEEKTIRELSGSKRLCGLAFTVDIPSTLRAERRAAGPPPASQLCAFKHEIIWS